MFIDLALEPNEVSFVKIQKNESSNNVLAQQQEVEPKTSLSVQGFNEEGEVLFKYSNKDQNLTQTFGVSLKYYKPHIEKKFQNKDGGEIDPKSLTVMQNMSRTASEGAYVLRPEFEEGNYQYAYQYSNLDQNIIFQQGQSLD